MGECLDIQGAIEKSTSEVSLKDLTRKGFKHVKVLNHAAITRLISEAVDRVISSREREISASERQRVIDESRREFDSLARSRIEEQSRVGQLSAENETLRAEMEGLRRRVDAAAEVQAERDRVLASEKALLLAVEDYRARCAEKEQSHAALEARDRERQHAADARTESLNLEIAVLRERVSEADRSFAKSEGQLDAKNEEIARLSRAAEEGFARFAAEVEARLSTIGSGSGVDEALRGSLEGIRANIADIAKGRVAIRKAESFDAEAMIKFAERRTDETEVESNISKVQVKQTQAAGVKASLARLKELQKRSSE